MKAYTWVEWKEKFAREADGNKQKHHDLDCTALVPLEKVKMIKEKKP